MGNACCDDNYLLTKGACYSWWFLLRELKRQDNTHKSSPSEPGRMFQKFSEWLVDASLPEYAILQFTMWMKSFGS